MLRKITAIITCILMSGILLSASALGDFYGTVKFVYNCSDTRYEFQLDGYNENFVVIHGSNLYELTEEHFKRTYALLLAAHVNGNEIYVGTGQNNGSPLNTGGNCGNSTRMYNCHHIGIRK